MASEGPKVSFPPARRLGVENWKPEDFAEERRRRRLSQRVYEARRTALEGRGWTWVHRCSCQGGEALEDPSTGEQVPFEEACRIQEEREPGCMVPWPVFDSGWEPPTSDEGLVHVGVVERKPMEPMKGPGIFGLEVELPSLGSPLEGEPAHLTLERVLDYFEGVLLSLHRNPAGEPYLEMWADRGGANERWLVFRTTEAGLAQYLGREISLRDLLLGTPDGHVFVKDVDRTDKESWALLPVQSVPSDIIPDMDAMHDPDLEPSV